MRGGGLRPSSCLPGRSGAQRVGRSRARRGGQGRERRVALRTRAAPGGSGGTAAIAHRRIALLRGRVRADGCGWTACDGQGREGTRGDGDGDPSPPRDGPRGARSCRRGRGVGGERGAESGVSRARGSRCGTANQKGEGEQRPSPWDKVAGDSRGRGRCATAVTASIRGREREQGPVVMG